jgi:hypothetical protein
MIIKEWLCNLFEILLEGDFPLSLPIVQKRAHMLQPLQAKALVLISHKGQVKKNELTSKT